MENLSATKRRHRDPSGQWTGLLCLSLLLLVCSDWACQSPGNSRNARTDSSAPDSSKVLSVKTPGPPDTTTLKGDWFLQDLGGTAAGANLSSASLRFNTGKSNFTGSTGCNKISGLFWYSEEDTSLVFGDRFATTKMACPGENERVLLKNLQHTNHYRLRKGTLTLLADSSELSAWARAPVLPK